MKKKIRVLLMVVAFVIAMASIAGAEPSAIESALTFDFPLAGLGGAIGATMASFAPLFFLAAGLVIGIMFLNKGLVMLKKARG